MKISKPDFWDYLVFDADGISGIQDGAPKEIIASFNSFMLEELLNKYSELFNDNFPTECFHCREEEMFILIKKALKDGKPYKMQYEDGVVY